MKNQLTTRDASKMQEEAVAKALGGRRTANSGATAFSKGDVVSSVFIIECKTKMKESNSITVQKDWFDKLEEERIGMGKRMAAIAISFGDGKNHYIISEKHMKILVELLYSELQ